MSTNGNQATSGPEPAIVVGVGASAGGLEALTLLLSELPAQTGMAMVIVQHLDPKHPSQLAELLGRTTASPVLQAEDGMRLEPDHIYVMPQDVAMEIERGVLRLTPRSHSRGPHLPIDQFLRSLAADQRNRAISVILSGSASDGTLGSAEIKAAGGITFAQDGQTATFPDMPRNAINSGSIDMVLSPQEIARELHRICCGTYVAPTREADAEGEEGEEGKPQEAPETMGEILSLLRSATGADFSGYRSTTIDRRIRRRMALRQKETFAAYLELLRSDRAELNALYRDILINVTSFFRNPEVFEALKAEVFPAVLQGKSAETPIRIWAPGCSTGQEVYSLAIVLMEFLDTQPLRPPVQIFGTDINDSASVERARAGLYPHSIESEVSPERLHRFFTREDGGYRIGKAIREMCVFAQHDVTANPPFSRLDLISCRNLLIYLTPALQQRVIPMFHYALNPAGFLLLGPSEAVGRFGDLFELLDSGNRIYRKTPAILKAHPYLGEALRGPGGVPAPRPAGLRTPSAADLQREADRQLLNRYAPAGVLVNEELEILQFRGRTAPYLEPPPGEATFNLLRMARENLFVDLREAIEEVKRNGTPARRQVSANSQGQGGQPPAPVMLEVLPVRIPSTNAGGYLVLFEALPVAGAAGAPATPAAPAIPSEIARLRAELVSVREYLQAVIEQQSATNEELRAANEEAMSTNEELQSTNEELQTAKEELQSTNEELQTVNEELHSRNAEVSQTNDDLTNLLTSMRIPVVMLGMDLCIRRFTPSAGKLLNLIPSDIGRPIRHIRPSVPLPDLEPMVHDVIASMALREQETQDEQGRWYQLRLHPYRTSDNRIDGAIIVLLDITDARQAQEHLRISRDYALSIVNTVREPLLVLTAELRVKTVSQSFLAAFGVSHQQVEGHLLAELGSTPWGGTALRELLEQVARTGRPFADYELADEFPLIGRRTMLVNARRLVDDRGSHLILVAFEDITRRRELEQQLHGRMSEVQAANAAKDHFLATLSHELRTPLTPVLLSASSLESRSDLSTPIRADLAVMRRNVALEVRLIDDLLDITRIARGKLEMDPRPQDACRLMDEAIEICRSDIEAKGLTLSTKMQANAPAIMADGPRVQQVFWNILRNAIKFTPAGGRIEVRCWNEEPWVIVEVADSGKGIDPAILPKLFQPFEQGTVDVTRQFGGLGLGLAISRMIVDLHHGTLTARSAGKDQGSTFIVRLPTSAEAARLLGQVSASPAPAEPECIPEAMLPARLLLVEDHPDTGRMLTRLLGNLGYDVKLAADIASAKRLAAEWEFDLVLSDVGLPDGRGTDLMAHLREQHGLKGIALTGYGMEQDRAQTLESGFIEHLVKPVDLDQLKAAIVRCLDRGKRGHGDGG